MVALVCALFLWHLRSALVAIISLPLGVMTAFLVMRYQGINANIMSLGIAIAVGAMVDAAVVMIENAHKKLEAWQHAHPDQRLQGKERWDVITQAAEEVGPALFFSLLIITLSFIPVFTLEAQEGRLFGPLAFTKTYAMAAAAGLSVTLIPVLMGYWIRGRIPDEQKNPITRILIAAYRPALEWVLRRPKATLLIAVLALATTAWPLARLGGEFLPRLDEGDLLYMPSALPGLSAQRATELQLSNRMIKTVPEVDKVFGKAGRAETATDPAPLEMFETTVKLKPREQWRPGMTPEKLVEELDRAVKIPGLSISGFPYPQSHRYAGYRHQEPDRGEGDRQRPGRDRSHRCRGRAGRQGHSRRDVVTRGALDGRALRGCSDRPRSRRSLRLNIADVQAVIAGAVGGENVSETVEGLARFPINLRYAREWRDSPQRLAELPIFTPMGQQITLGTVARIAITDGPPMLKSENARPSGWVYVDVRGRDLASVANELRDAIGQQVKLEPGVSITYSGQFEYMERANARLKVVVPATLLIIFVLLYLTFARVDEAGLIMATLPFALTGASGSCTC